MTRAEAQEILQAIKHYLTAGNPVWDVDEIAEACDMGIEALRNEINCVKCEHYTERETATGIKGVCKMDTAHRGDTISRQAVIELVKNSYYNLEENMDDVWAMVADVEQIPSADAVEVVRCKDCETIDENGWCEFVNGYVHDGFCAWGKRKGGDSE